MVVRASLSLNILLALMPSSNSVLFGGLVARGGFVVGESWSNSKLVNATISEGAKTAEGFAEWISMNTTAGKTYIFIAEV